MDATPTTAQNAQALSHAHAGPRASGPALRLARAYADHAPIAPDATSPRSPDVVSFSFPREAQTPAAMPAKARSLVAATVSAAPAPTLPAAEQAGPGSLAFYRHPADRNTAATAIAAGRTLDVQG